MAYSLATVAPAKVSTTTVDLSSTGQTTLYTVPTGKLFIPVFALLRAAGDLATSIGTVITMGRSTDLNDWLDYQDLTNLEASGDVALLMPPIAGIVDSSADKQLPVKLKSYAAGVIFQVDVVTADGVAGNSIDLFGVLIDV